MLSSILSFAVLTSPAPSSPFFNHDALLTLIGSPAGSPPQATGFVAKFWNAPKATVEKALGKPYRASKSGQHGYTVHFTAHKGPKLVKLVPGATESTFTYWWKDPRVAFLDIYFKVGTTHDAVLKRAGLSMAEVSEPYHGSGKPGDDTAYQTFLKEDYESDPKAFKEWRPDWSDYRYYDVTGHGLKNAKVQIVVQERLNKDAKIVDTELSLTVSTTRKS